MSDVDFLTIVISANQELCRHRKPAVDADGNKVQQSPRKAIPTDGSYGTIF